MVRPGDLLSRAVTEIRYKILERNLVNFFERGDGATITETQISIVERTMTDERVKVILDSCLGTVDARSVDVFEKLSATELAVFCERLGIVKIEK